RLLRHDLRVVAGVGRRGHRGDERVEVRRAARTPEVAAAVELGGHRDGVRGLSPRVQVQDDVVDGLVRRLVEVPGLDLLHHVRDGVLAQEHAAQDRLLRGEVLRRGTTELGAALVRRWRHLAGTVESPLRHDRSSPFDLIGATRQPSGHARDVSTVGHRRDTPDPPNAWLSTGLSTLVIRHLWNSVDGYW